MAETHIPGRISFVILTWNSQNYIRNCVGAVFSSLDPSAWDVEIFVVDNGSQDHTRAIIQDLVKDFPERVIPICLDQNYGTTRPRNLALSRCRGEYICVMDSDVVVRPGTITRLIRTLNADRRTGLAVPRLVYPDGHLQKSVDLFPTLGRKIIRYVGLKSMEAREARNAGTSEVRPVDYAISALWVFRQALIREVGGLDEKIFYAPEDADFCLRIWKAGKQVVYDPLAVAVHHTQEVGRGFRINRMVLHHISGLAYFFLKHRFLLCRPKFERPGSGGKASKGKS